MRSLQSKNNVFENIMKINDIKDDWDLNDFKVSLNLFSSFWKLIKCLYSN